MIPEPNAPNAPPDGLLSERTREALTVRRALSALSSARAPEEVITGVLESLGDGFGFSSGAYLNYDAREGALRLTLVWGSVDTNLRNAWSRIELDAARMTLGLAEGKVRVSCVHESEPLADRRAHSALLAAGVATLVSVPLAGEDAPHGVLLLFAKERVSFSDERLSVVSSLGDAVASLLTRMCALERTENRAKSAELESFVLRRIHAAMTPSDTIRFGLEALRAALDFNYGACFTPSGEDSELTAGEQTGHAPDAFVQATMAARYVPAVGAVGHCFSTAELVVVPDLSASEGEPRAHAAREAGIHTGVCLPLTMRGEVAHVLEVWSTRHERLSTEQQSALTRVGQALSTTLERLEERDGFAWALRDFASELTDVSSALRATTAEQSRSAQELASSIAQVRATLSQLRETSAEARRIAESVILKAEGAYESSASGRESVERAVQSMRAIREQVGTIAERILQLNHHTSQIDSIISTVNEISSQSKLLALNAAIEAARAGEHGKGFSVVATEIRSLAEQSKQATSQVRAILGEIQASTNAAVVAAEEGTKKSESGMALAELSGGKIQDLARAMEQSSLSARQIADSANQQGTGIEQVAQALVAISNATNATAAGLKQTEYATEQLVALAERITRILLSMGPSEAVPDSLTPARDAAQ